MIKRGNSEQTSNERKVSWTTFVWVIGIIFVVFSLIFNQIRILDAKTGLIQLSYTTIKEDIRELKTNMQWVVETMKKKGN